MTTDNNKNSQRNKRCTVSFTEEEHNTIFDAAIAKNYSNKAIARYIREELLSSISSADQSPSIIVPAVNEQLASDLQGAVNNLNQTVKVLHQLTITSTQSAQIQQAEEIMKHVIQTSELCKDLRDFSKGKTKNLSLLANIVIDTFEEQDFRRLVAFYKKKKGIK